VQVNHRQIHQHRAKQRQDNKVDSTNAPPVGFWAMAKLRSAWNPVGGPGKLGGSENSAKFLIRGDTAMIKR
jgi:hypothetical protein